MKTAYCIVVIALAIISTAAFAGPSADRILCDFEQEADLAKFDVRKSTPPTQFTLSPEHIMSGSHSAKIVYPKWQPDSEENPAVIFKADKGMPGDWHGYDYVAVDIYNTSAQHMIDLGLFIRDGGKHAMGMHYYIPPLEKRTLRFNLNFVPVDFDLADVREFHIYCSRPPEETTIFVDRVRLENERESEISASKKQMKLRLVDEARMRESFAAIAPNLPYSCGFTSSMEKVFPKDVHFNASVARSAKVSLAGNEVESVQLLILANDRDLKYTNVVSGEVRRADNKKVSVVPSIQISPVGFVKTKKPPYPVRYVGWYPDPILDFLTSYDIKKGDLQPVWIRVNAPAGTPAGDYIADLTVKPANAPSVRLRLKVHVWGFDLPKENHLRNAMSLYEDYMSKTYVEASDSMRAKYQDFVLRYRINPDNIYRAVPPKIQDIERWNSQGLNAFNITHVVKVEGIKQGEPYPEARKREIMARLNSLIPQLKEKNLYSKAYVYGFDEVNGDSFAAMQDIFSAIKAKYPDLPLMTTAYDSSYGEISKLDCVDIWVPLTPRYDYVRAQEARARGKQVWWYICISPKEPFANWLIEDDAIEARSLMGLQTVKYKPDGFLYYAMTRWPLTKKPITDGPYTDWPPASYMDCNGDGSIICAGPTGPLATIRLENIRDGIEDYEYFWLLRQEIEKLKDCAGPTAAVVLARAQKAAEIGDDLVKDLTSFSRSPEAIYAKRKQVAEAILAARKITQP